MIAKTMRELVRYGFTAFSFEDGAYFFSSAFVLSLASCQEKDGSMRAVSICTKSRFDGKTYIRSWDTVLARSVWRTVVFKAQGFPCVVRNHVPFSEGCKVSINE